MRSGTWSDRTAAFSFQSRQASASGILCRNSARSQCPHQPGHTSSLVSQSAVSRSLSWGSTSSQCDDLNRARDVRATPRSMQVPSPYRLEDAASFVEPGISLTGMTVARPSSQLRMLPLAPGWAGSACAWEGTPRASARPAALNPSFGHPGSGASRAPTWPGRAFRAAGPAAGSVPGSAGCPASYG
jgi:hypothetical protein